MTMMLFFSPMSSDCIVSFSVAVKITRLGSAVFCTELQNLLMTCRSVDDALVASWA